jgi:hypothetical protein
MSAPPSTEAPVAISHSLRITRGSLYLDRGLCDLYLPGISSVALLQRDGQVLLLPLHGATAGGALLKTRNARGDRVVHAPEFLRTLGIDDSDPARIVSVRWVSEVAGLLLQGLRPAATG